ncbi:ATP-binding protein [Micromonospora arborensis]|uniref:ATP-binding protein n=1 Tax=Micromonospora arborensis TaxID=2116518 RepID=UPI00142DD2D1|nr:ATP-binding protein [Micromonospora arborensis]
MLDDAGIVASEVQERTFPGERWLIAFVPEDSIMVAQSLAGAIERELNEMPGEDSAFAVTFRPQILSGGEEPVARPAAGGLASRDVDHLIQLLEARSRTSDALPSLKYVEDPRASLAAVGASRHQLVYGRRGVGKTALLLEAKRQAEKQGHVIVWTNAHVLRKLTAESAFSVIAEAAVASIAKRRGSSAAEAFSRLDEVSRELGIARRSRLRSEQKVVEKIPRLNQCLRAILRTGVMTMYIFIDDFYLLPSALQPQLLDYVAGMLRDCNGWIKLASIERLTRPYEPSTRVGLEVPHDASKIDLDITLEDPSAAQIFLESVLSNYTLTAGIKNFASITKPEARGRLVLASGGVPRDYLNLFASSIVVARERVQPREIGREDVAKAAGRSARSKKRDLEQDVSSENSGILLEALEYISAYVMGEGCTYFRVDMSRKTHPAYEVLGQLVDLRFAHLVQAALSDKHRPGTKYEAYILDLSEYTDVRLKRGLRVLDLEEGKWTVRQSGKAATTKRLSGTQLRDLLRQGPLIDLDNLPRVLDQTSSPAYPIDIRR